mgnify:FL=1|jgi:hypothetical protein
MGVQGATSQAAIANAAAAQGISAEQFAGQMAAQSGQLGQSMAQMGMQGAQQQGQLGQGMSQLGLQGAQQAGQLGLQGAQMQSEIGQGIGALGANYAQLGLQGGQALGTLGLQQASLGELQQNLGQKQDAFLFDLGKQDQAQRQAVLEADRASDLAQIYEPYNRLGFVSDIYKGAPSTQMSVSGSSAPNVSSAQSMLGLGVAGLSAAAGARSAGLFGGGG